MNLILSKNWDFSTNEVCEWFYLKNRPFKRVNVSNHEQNSAHNIELEGVVNFHLDERAYRTAAFSNQYKSVWYRKPKLSLFHVPIWSPDSLKTNETLNREIKTNRKLELSRLYDYLVHNIEADIALGSYEITSLNKLIVLEAAEEAGLAIPKTIVASQKSFLLEFLSKCDTGVIAKSLYEPIHVDAKDVDAFFISYTLHIDGDHIEFIPETFSPSLVQERLDKEYEIRSFYLDGRFYSMAIFSQSNENTKVDFRRYDSERPNRTVPYKLPIDIEASLTQLMQSVDLNCGSIDIIKTKEGFVFLEINPVGQFGMVSKPCNYNIERDIYKYLTSYERG